MQYHMESPVGARTVINGIEVDYFAGCGYLGLQSHPQVLKAAWEAINQFGISTATSRGGYGENVIYDDLENEARVYFGAEEILYFASGYLGMAILTQASGKAHDHYFIDSEAHFNLWDAASASNHAITVFHHLQAESLEETINKDLEVGERTIVLSDGVFPISGEIAPLPDYLDVVKSYRGLVYVDDAHAAGVLGKNGRGSAEYFDIQDDHCRTTATLSKALGGWGGVIWGDAGWIEGLDRGSRVMEGASPPPLVMAAASAKALQIAHNHPELRRQLWLNVAQVRAGLRVLGWEMEDTPVPIICLRSNERINLSRLQTRLFEKGLAVEYVRHYSSTPPGGAIRIAIFATHSQEQIDRLLEEIGKFV